MRSGWSSTQLPNASSHTTPGPVSSVSTARSSSSANRLNLPDFL